MQSGHYIINNRFVVNPSANEITDKYAETVHHLEPRLMETLSLLIRFKGTVVSRDEVISEVWEDYPGGSEALNQAISQLRKVLDDTTKNVIETIPKRGYRFAGVVESSISTTKTRATAISSQKISVAVIASVLVVFIIWLMLPSKSHIGNSMSHEEVLIRLGRIDSAKQADQKKIGN